MIDPKSELITDPESILAWFREDSLANDHHFHWHIVYHYEGIIDRKTRQRKLKERQGELFLYMHQQMLARYDTERLAVDLPPVKPLSNFRKSIPEGYDPGSSFPKYTARPPGMQMQDIDRVLNSKKYEYTIDNHEIKETRLREALSAGFFNNNEPVEPNLLGATIESTVGSVSGAKSHFSIAARHHLSSYYGNFHGMCHMLLAFITDPDGTQGTQKGVMLDEETAIRDPVFYRWHKHIDDFSYEWQQGQAPHDWSDAPQVRIRNNLNGSTSVSQSPDIILSYKARVPDANDPVTLSGQDYGEYVFGGKNWNKDFSASEVATNELQTIMRERQILDENGNSTITIPYLDHKEFFYFLRVENLINRTQEVTVRIFLVAKELANNRRMWIEMDKFRYTLAAFQKAVICRPGSLSSVIRKPAVRPPGAAKMSSTDAYCSCGWPYNLLLPRGTHEGMPFRLMVMITDWEKDRVGSDAEGGSMSFCGARDKYPDNRSMGYPFDRPFAVGRSIEQTIASQENMVARDVIIKWVS